MTTKVQTTVIEASDLQGARIECNNCHTPLNAHNVPPGVPHYTQNADHELTHWNSNCFKCGAPITILND